MRQLLRSSVYVVIAIAICVMAMAICFSPATPTTTNISNPVVHIENAANVDWNTSSGNHYNYVYDNGRLEDGTAGSESTANFTTYTGWTLNGSTSLKLDNNVTYTKSDNVVWNGETYQNATFDGQGKTLTLKTHYYRTQELGQGSFGFLTQYMRNVTIRNMTIVIDFLVKNTKDFAGGNAIDLGIMAGTATNVTVENVKIKIQRSAESYFLNTWFKGDSTAIYMGHLFGRAENCTFKNVTVEFEKNVEVYFSKGGTSTGDRWFVYGSLAGIATGNTTVTNVTARSTIGTVTISTRTDHDCLKPRLGVLFGQLNAGNNQNSILSGIDLGGINVTFSDSSYSMYSKDRLCGKIAGEAFGTTNIYDVFYKDGSVYANNAYRVVGNNASQAVSRERKYYCAESEIGFVKGQTAYYWVGTPSSFSGSGNDITGQYVKEVKIGSNTHFVAQGIAPTAVANISKKVLPAFKKDVYYGNIGSSTTDVGFSMGNFAYSNTASGRLWIDGNHKEPTRTPDTEYTWQTYYNTKTINNVKTCADVYRAGNKLTNQEASLPWTKPSGDVKNAGTYEYTSNVFNPGNNKKYHTAGQFLGEENDYSYFAVYGDANPTSLVLVISSAEEVIITTDDPTSAAGEITSTTTNNISLNVANNTDKDWIKEAEIENNVYCYEISYDGGKHISISKKLTIYVKGNDDKHYKVTDIDIGLATRENPQKPENVVAATVGGFEEFRVANVNYNAGVLPYKFRYSLNQQGKTDLSNNFVVKNYDVDIQINQLISNMSDDDYLAYTYCANTINPAKDYGGIPDSAVNYYSYFLSTGTALTTTNGGQTTTINGQNKILPKDVGIYKLQISEYTNPDDPNILIQAGEWYFIITPALVNVDFIARVFNNEKSGSISTTPYNSQTNPNGNYSYSGFLNNETGINYIPFGGTIQLGEFEDINVSTDYKWFTFNTLLVSREEFPVRISERNIYPWNYETGRAESTALTQNQLIYMRAKTGKQGSANTFNSNYAFNTPDAYAYNTTNATIDEAVMYVDSGVTKLKVKKGIITPKAIDIVKITKPFDNTDSVTNTANVNIIKHKSPNGNNYISQTTQGTQDSYSYYSIEFNITQTYSLNPFSNFNETTSLGTYSSANVGSGLNITFNANAVEKFTLAHKEVKGRIIGTNFAINTLNYSGDNPVVNGVGEIFPKMISVDSMAARTFDETANVYFDNVGFAGMLNDKTNLKFGNGNPIIARFSSSADGSNSYIHAGTRERYIVFDSTALQNATVYVGDKNSATLANQFGTAQAIKRINNSNYCFSYDNTSKEIFVTQNYEMVTKAPVYIYFDDTKELYDSILDTVWENGTKYYDFIYTQGSDYTSTYFNKFNERYTAHFRGFVRANQTGSYTTNPFANYITINQVVLGGNQQIVYSWATDLNNSDPYNIKNNYNIGDVRAITSGAGRAVDQAYAYCDSAFNKSNGTARIRIKLVTDVQATNTDWASNSSMNNRSKVGLDQMDNSNNEKPTIYKFMSSYYYDNYDNNATTYTLPANATFWYNRLFTGFRSMPSYKTINGNGSTFYVKNFAEERLDHYFEITGRQDDAATVKESEGLLTDNIRTIENHKYKYPAFLQNDGISYFGKNSVLADTTNSMIHGAGAFLAINYGTIKGFVFDFFQDESGGNAQGCRHVIQGFKNVHTSIGAVMGINCGIFTNNTVKPHRQYRFNARASGKNFAFGSICGINLGEISNKGTLKTLVAMDRTLADKWTSTFSSGTISYYTYLMAVGEANNYYFGVISGVNGKSAEIKSEQLNTFTNNAIIWVTPSATKLFAGGFVGHNEGTINNLQFINNQHNNTGKNTSNDNNQSTNLDYTYQNHEFDVRSSASMAVGGICGYNKNGSIENCTFVNNGRINAETIVADKSVHAGGIVGYNEGIKNVDTSGRILNASFTNNRTFDVGSDSVKLKTYTAGGIAGLTTGGYLSNVKSINYGTFWARTKATYATDSAYYLGGLVGVGCEEGTTSTSNRMRIKYTMFLSNSDTLVVSEGSILNAQAFNFSADRQSFGANYGYWGYVAGTYNTISELRTGATNAFGEEYSYVHEYGGIIWYTRTVPYIGNTQQEYPKSIFGNIASVLGRNASIQENPSQTTLDNYNNVLITGIAGIGLADFGDGRAAAALLNGIAINGSNIEIAYNKPKDLGGSANSTPYTHMTAFLMDLEGNKIELSINSNGATNKNPKDANYTGTIIVPQSDANAIVTSFVEPAAIAVVYACLYVDIDAQWKWNAFLGDEYSCNNGQIGNVLYANNGGPWYYCAGYGSLTANLSFYNNYKPDGADPSIFTPREITKYKTFDGNNRTITFTRGGYRSTLPASNYYAYNMLNDRGNAIAAYGAGLLVGANNGTIKNLTINVDVTNNGANATSGSNNGITFDVGHNSIVGVGALCGINTGIIENCRVNLHCPFGTEIDANNVTTQIALGAAIGLNDGGKINYLLVNYTYKYDKNNKLVNAEVVAWSRSAPTNGGPITAVGGVIGVANGGVYNSVQALGTGQIRLPNENHHEGYVGGLFGCLPLSETVKFGHSNAYGFFNLTPVESMNKLTVGLNGRYGAGIQNPLLSRAGAGYIAGIIATSLVEAESPLVYNKIKNANVTALVFGDVDAFQKSGRNENSLYGYLPDYAKDFTREQNRPAYQVAIMTNRFVIEDGSNNGYGAMEQANDITPSGSFGWSNDLVVRININFTYKEGVVANTPSITYNAARSVSYGGSASTTATNATISNVGRNMNQRGFYHVFEMKYEVNIASESVPWDVNTAINDSKFMNFITGRGSQWVYAGATKGNLQGDIYYNKQISSVVELGKRKTLNGNGYTFRADWDTKTRTTDQIMGITEILIKSGNEGTGETIGGNNANNEAEYNLWYEASNKGVITRYYGVSDFISINRGTISNIKFKINEANGAHFYNGLTGSNANTAYGAFCGINLGTISNNCEAITKFNTAGKVSTFKANNANAELLASPGIGLNNGTVSDFKVTLDSTYRFDGQVKSLIMGGVAAVNAMYGSLTRINCKINATLERKCQAMDTQDGSVVFGGLVGINDGGAVKYATIDGEGSIFVTTTDRDTFNLVNKETGDPIFVNDTKYLYFAIGIAVSNNDWDYTPVIAGHEINPCVSEVNGRYTNKVSHILLNFEGNLIYSTSQYYVAGLAFARASYSAQTSTMSPAYEAIIMSNKYGSYVDLIAASSAYTQNRYWGLVIGAGLPFMGHVEQNIGASDFVNGGRVDSNADIILEWDTTNGSLIIRSPYGRMTNLNAVILEELPEKREVRRHVKGDTSYIIYDETVNRARVEVKMAYILEMKNEISLLMQLFIDYDFPYADISDIYQLRQFLEFDEKDSADVFKSGYLQKYQAAIVSLIGTNKELTTATNPYGKAIGAKTVVDQVRANNSAINALWTEDTMVLYTSGTGTEYYILPEIYMYNGEPFLYYNSSFGRITQDLVLNKYNNMTVNLGWDVTVQFEMDESKVLDGQGHKITLVASSVDPNVSTIDLPDKQQTVVQDLNVLYIASAFIGIVRGELNNINFVFKENTALNMVRENSMNKFLDWKASLFAGLIAGYTTGIIDSCTLTMEDNTQVYIYKVRNDGGSIFTSGSFNNNSSYTTNNLGGFTGVLGKGARISNSTLTMGENAVLAMNSHGVSWGASGPQGSVFNYVGGFVGEMSDKSVLYNLKIDGAASSLLMSVSVFLEQYGVGSFNCLYAATGGIVGCNSANSNSWDPKRVGRGSIDGVIFNWRGACLNMIWFDGGIGGSNVGGNRNKIKVTYYGGAALGAVDDGTASNFYYTFDIASFAKDVNKEFSNARNVGSGVFLQGINSQYTQASTYYPSITYSVLENGTYKVKKDLTGEQFARGTYYTNRNYVLPIMQHNEYFIDDNSSHDKTGYALSLSEVMTGSQETVIPKTLRVWEMISPETYGTGITFTKGPKDPSSTDRAFTYKNVTDIQVSASAYKELTTMGDVLSWGGKNKAADIICEFTADPQDLAAVMWAIYITGAENEGTKLKNSLNTITEIPVYRFATSIADANTYKHVSYTIKRGEGDGMNLYYCTGNAATLRPDGNYYVNQAGTTIFNPKAAIMYDGKTDATKVAVNVYDQNGDRIDRLQGMDSIIVDMAKATGGITTEVKEKNAQGSYSNVGEDATKIGTYRITYYIKPNKENPSDTEFINNNAYVDNNYRVQFFSSDGLGAIDGIIEEYEINLVIAPIFLNPTSIYKVYDGDVVLHNNSISNFSVVASNLVIDPYSFPFVYSPEIEFGTQTTSIRDEIKVNKSGFDKLKSTLVGEYNSADVGEEKIVYLTIDKKFTYEIYEENGTTKKTISTYLLKNKIGNACFTIYQMVDSNTYAISDRVNETDKIFRIDKEICPVKIIKANPPTITVQSGVLSYEYTGNKIIYGQELADWITITDPYGRNLPVASLINSGVVTILAGEEIKAVKSGGYDKTITIKYDEGASPNMPSVTETVSVKIYITPKEITVDKVIKPWDDNNQITGAQIKVSGLVANDTQTGTTNSFMVVSTTGVNANTSFNATYATKDVGKNIRINITTTSMSLNGTTYNVVLNNYYLKNNTTPTVGIITPADAEIVNAYKMFDGTNTVTYGEADTNTKMLIRDANGNKLAFEPQATYAVNTVGNTSINITLEVFEYSDINNTTIRKYRLKDGATATNYAIANATSTNYSAAVAHIIPKPIVVNSVFKVYDGNTNLGDFDISGTITGFSHTKFDGSYNDANVNYDGTSYNNVILNTSTVEYTYHEGNQIKTGTYSTLKENQTDTNYTIDLNATGFNYETSATSITIVGKGVIAPKQVTLTAVKKIFDGRNTFNSADFENPTAPDAMEYVEFDDNGTKFRTYYLSGTMSGINATNGSNLYTVTVEYTEFRYDGVTYIWLTHVSNMNKNYCLASDTVPNVGDVLQRKLSVTNNSVGSTGQLSNLRFITPDGEKKVNANDVKYTYKYTYTIANLKADMRWNGQLVNLNNGRITVANTTLQFNLTVVNKPSSATTDNFVAGDYKFRLTLATTSSNFTFGDAGYYEFTFKINKRDINNSSSNYLKVYMENPTKTYDGTNQVVGITASGAIAIKADVPGANNTTDSVTVWTRPAANAFTANTEIENTPLRFPAALPETAIDVGVYSNIGMYLVISGTLESANYKFTGNVNDNNIYSDSSYTTRLALEVVPVQLTFEAAVEKEFDGTSGTIKVAGVNNEIVYLSYDIPSKGILPGSYEEVATTITATGVEIEGEFIAEKAVNYVVEENTLLNLVVNNAIVNVERGYENDAFNVSVSISNLKGLEFLYQANANLQETTLTALANNQTTDLTEVKNALTNIFAIKFNEAGWKGLDVDNILNIAIIKTTLASGEDRYAVKFSIKNDKLDSLTYTDRYSIFMRNKDLQQVITNGNYNNYIGSNIVESSSELAEGQFDGNTAITGTPIASIADLVAFMNRAETGTGYLTTSIYGFDATQINGTLAQGKVLDGRGNSIVITGAAKMNGDTTIGGAFVLENAGVIRNVNFAYASVEEISYENAAIGLVAGTNSGTIENCSIKILSEPRILQVEVEGAATPTTEPIAVNIAGMVANNSGNINYVSVIFSTSISLGVEGAATSNATMAGITLNNTGAINYVAARQIKDTIALHPSIKAIASQSTNDIQYVIYALSNNQPMMGTGNITKTYGVGATALKMFSTINQRGFVDYYFTNNNKFTSTGELHNNYTQTNKTNASHYYGYDASYAGYSLAIEVIAPLDDFIWEAFDANYITHQTNLNRAVGLFKVPTQGVLELVDSNSDATFKLSQTSVDPDITFITSHSGVWVTIFNPAIGIIVKTEVAGGNQEAVKEYEFTGNTIQAEFNVIEPDNTLSTLYISGTDVGSYTEYYKKIEGEGGVQNQIEPTFDPQNLQAKVLSTDGSAGTAQIMLIITPKVDGTINAGLEKQYDTTNIAETHIDLTNNGKVDLYAVGEYSGSDVGDNYDVSYKSFSKPVAAHLVNGTYKFLTVYLAGVSIDYKRIYNVEHITMDGTEFTSATTPSTANFNAYARAYSQMVTMERLQQLQADDSCELNLTNVGVNAITELQVVYVYDLIFGQSTVNGQVQYDSSKGIDYAVSLFNTTEAGVLANTINTNHKWQIEDTNKFAMDNSILVSATATEPTAIISKTVTNATTRGVIVKRIIEAEYSNLDQSYRKPLKQITPKVSAATSISNLPFSLSATERESIENTINAQIASASFAGDVLAGTYYEGHPQLEYDAASNTYYAKNKIYQEIPLTTGEGTLESTNFRISVTGEPKLKLRYFDTEIVDGQTKHILESINDFMMINEQLDGSEIGETDYDVLDYILKADIHGKSKELSTITRTFKGTINGGGYTVKYFVLVGNDTTGIFENLDVNASIYDISFTNVMVLQKSTGYASVVAKVSSGRIENVSVEGEVVVNGTNTTTIAPIATTVYGTTANNKAFIQTAADATNAYNQLKGMENDTNSREILVFRRYGHKTPYGNIAKISVGATTVEDTIIESATALDAIVNATKNVDVFNLALNSIKARADVTIPLRINAQNQAVIENFRQYWVYINICPWLQATNVTSFFGKEFELR